MPETVSQKDRDENMALTDEDIARIADEMERRMSKRDEKPSHASYGGNGRYSFEDGIGDVYDLSDYMRRPPLLT